MNKIRWKSWKYNLKNLLIFKFPIIVIILSRTAVPSSQINVNSSTLRICTVESAFDVPLFCFFDLLFVPWYFSYVRILSSRVHIVKICILPFYSNRNDSRSSPVRIHVHESFCRHYFRTSIEVWLTRTIHWYLILPFKVSQPNKNFLSE